MEYSTRCALMLALFVAAPGMVHVQAQEADSSTVDSATGAWPGCAQGKSRRAEATCAYLERRDAIAAREAGMPLDSLVGIYACGNGAQGVEIALDSDGWAGVHEFSDVGSQPAIAGHYSLRNGLLVIELEYPLAYAPDTKQLRYFPVHWTKRLFLLTADELGEIVSILNRDGLDSEIFQTMREKLERVRARNKPLCGAPDLPPEWRTYLHPIPLHIALAAARADSKVAGEPQRYSVEFAAGRRQGLFAGMSLRGTAQQFPHARVWAKVERVEAGHASGWLRAEAEDRSYLDAVRIDMNTELVSGKGWGATECVPPR